MSDDQLQQVVERLTQIDRHPGQISRVTGETGTPTIVHVALHELLDCPSLRFAGPDAEEVAHIETILSALWRAGTQGDE